MQALPLIQKYLLFSLMIYLGHSSIQLKYTFPYNSDGTSAAYLNNPVYKPLYDLGVL